MSRMSDMNRGACASLPASCAVDRRRAWVQASDHLCGLDEVEVATDGTTLQVRLFGCVPEALGAHHLRIEGGERIRGIRVLSARFTADDDGDVCMQVVVDRRGDFSTYRLCLVEPDPDPKPSREPQGAGNAACSHDPLPPAPLVRRVPAGVDPRYACVEFGFRIDCPSPLDCRPQPCPPQPRPAPPAIDYLARDFPSFRALLLDRLATTMPQWRERHVPDLGLTLVELLAWRADQLSYQLDAVATEAYLATARRRISVRRHARLVDYRLHEGCNARAWITLDSDSDLSLDLGDLVFACPAADTELATGGVIEWPALQKTAGATFFEAIALPGTFVDVPDADAPARSPPATKPVIQVRAAHSTIYFHTWRMQACCLPQGSTRATLLDQADVPATATATAVGTPDGKPPLPHADGKAPPPRQRVLDLVEGNFLILEEAVGAATGLRADTDRSKRHVVKLVRLQQTIDPLDGTLLLEVEWDRRDALPFALCLSARTAAPACKTIDVAVVHGNVLLVDHGVHVDEVNDGWVVGTEHETACCECDGMVSDLVSQPAPLRLALGRTQITHAEPPPAQSPASALCAQDPRKALPAIGLCSAPTHPRAGGPAGEADTRAWRPMADMLTSEGSDAVFVAEIDDDGFAQIRFGDGNAGLQPQAGWRFAASYRIGNGTPGQVGADSIVWMARRSGPITGAALHPRNPLPACGGIDPEPVADAKLFAPHAYARVLERAVRAEDYAQIALADPRIEGANAHLAWTGTGYEATVALDAYAAAQGDTDLPDGTLARLLAVRRIGHDVRVVPARRVPLRIALDVCVAPGHARADIVRVLLDTLSNRVVANGELGLFHFDRLVFGGDVAASPLLAAVQRVAGVAHVELTAFARADADDASARQSLADSLIAIADDEIAQLDNDPSFPERGELGLTARGGR